MEEFLVYVVSFVATGVAFIAAWYKIRRGVAAENLPEHAVGQCRELSGVSGVSCRAAFCLRETGAR